MQDFLDAQGSVPAVYDRWTGERERSSAGASAAGGWPDRVDTAVVGGGITGLSAACHLAEAGASVAVLEAREVGWGASGRAFGQIVPTLTHGGDGVLAHFGPERGERIVADVAAGPDLVFDLIARHRIDCGAVRTGLLFAAHSLAGRRALERRTAEWRRRGAPVEMLDAAATAEAVGSGHYAAACLDRRGGHLNPLGYTRGLARAAAGAGAAIFTGRRVTRLERRGGAWALEAAGDVMLADSVILATNAHTGGLWPELARSIVPMRVHAAVTAPQPAAILDGLLPGGQSLTDTRRLYSGVRRVNEGRLHLTVDGPAFRSGGAPHLAAATRRLASLLPADMPEAPPAWAESWSGWIALTPERMPRVHRLAPGLYAGLGYSGRGLAAATMVGRDLARRIAGAGEADVTFPLSPLRPIRARALAGPGIGALIRFWRLLDRLDEARARLSF